ncbi:hypothetical protein BABINDRAFT_163187 [Babjeviella inositovora NRRL Y-12698]|uniref:Nuclear distribution protein PAC1 n=1 Tax=Babjeviella inositovora NRRL Y-12698 TaxID=984486 RepID=A0A1E3QJF7_9ASCO|nr:uncharacterized protein BABINDRAFT_163187 [Babjeviella inositovora NRRL Y-12698]ODQ77800.1 hypothetical protein BABINDRAFT_163187 [Babjeviella inositovora NRRL Y-12698]
MSFLSERQRQELNKSLVQYLRPVLPAVAAQLQEQFAVSDDDLTKIIPDYLEKKWSTVLRLQKKILDLENQVEHLTSVLESNDLHQMASEAARKLDWLPSRNSKILKAHRDSVTCVTVHPYLPQLVSGGMDGTFVVWDLLNATEPERIVRAHARAITAVAFAPRESVNKSTNKKQTLFATCSADLFIKIWDADFNLVRTLSGHDHSVSALAFSPANPNHLYSCSRDKTVKLWDLTSGWCVKSFVGHSEWVRALDVSPNGAYVLSASADQSLRLSHGESGTGLALLVGHHQVVETCKFAPKSAYKFLDPLAAQAVARELVDLEGYEALSVKYAVTGGRDDTIRVWLLPLPTERAHRPPLPASNPSATCFLELKGHTSWVRALQVHPNGRFLFSASDDRSIKIWDLERKGKCVRTLNGHEGFVNAITMAPPHNPETNVEESKDDEEALTKSIRCIFASGGGDNTVRLWN